MTDETMTEWREGLRYRILYGFACRFLDGANRTAYTREGARLVQADDLLAEVLRIASVDQDDLDTMEVAREAVDDARAGWQPKW